MESGLWDWVECLYKALISVLDQPGNAVWYLTVFLLPGMNAAVVLVALLLAVPVQLLVSHYISKSYEAGEDSGITEVRAAAIKQ